MTDKEEEVIEIDENGHVHYPDPSKCPKCGQQMEWTATSPVVNARMEWRCFKCPTDLGQVSQGVAPSLPSSPQPRNKVWCAPENRGDQNDGYNPMAGCTGEGRPTCTATECFYGMTDDMMPKKSPQPSLTGLIEQWRREANTQIESKEYNQRLLRCADELATLLAGKEQS